MAHSSSRPSRAPAVVATVSGASVLIDAVTSANDREVLKVLLAMKQKQRGTRNARGGVWRRRWRRGQPGGGKEENSTDGQLRREEKRESPFCYERRE